MAASPLNPKTNYHARSVSLPSRPHPFFLLIGEHLCRLKASEETTVSSSLSITKSISILLDLYDCVDDFLQLSTTHGVLADQQSCPKWVNDMFDGSLKLLDVCSTIKDVLLQFKERAQQLQSILRRRRGDETEFAKEVSKYSMFKKKACKVVQKSLKDLKGKSGAFSYLDQKDQCGKEAVISMLNEVERVTFALFESMLSFLSRTKTTNGWSLLSKLVKTKSVDCEKEMSQTSEIETVDAELYALMRKCSNQMQIQKVQDKLGNLERSIQDLEEGLETLLRRLIKTRVSLLNILNN